MYTITIIILAQIKITRIIQSIHLPKKETYRKFGTLDVQNIIFNVGRIIT